MHLAKLLWSASIWLMLVDVVRPQIARIRKNVSLAVLDSYGIDHSILDQSIPESGLIVQLGSQERRQDPRKNKIPGRLDLQGKQSATVGGASAPPRVNASLDEEQKRKLTKIKDQESLNVLSTNSLENDVSNKTANLNSTDTVCGRVPLYEKLYGKSFNTSHLDESGHFRIIHGLDAVVGEWPWIVRIEDCKPGGDCGICTGTLLNERWVITAGHCGFNKSAANLNATFGLYDLLSPEQESFKRSIDRIVVHPNYNDLNNDLTLLHLSQPVEFNDRIRPVCLVPPTRNLIKTVGDMPAFAVGYGLTDGMMEAVRLQKLRVFPKNPVDCNSDILGSVQLRRNTLCIGPPEGKIGGSCKGDSGGPDLYYDPKQNRWFIFATVSFGPADCDREDGDKWLTVSVDLSSYRSWILKTIN